MFAFRFTVTIFKKTCHGIIHKRLVSDRVRVRFAPSPTGFLHLGGLRTALYNHLYAKSLNGTTILRIEDTDLSRKVPLAAENLIKDLAWFGIEYDEGPYFQSERKEIYQKYAEQLIKQGDAYYCFCSNIRLYLVKKEAVKAGEIPKYDNACRNLRKEEVENNLKSGSFCIRFKLSSSQVTYDDLVWGCRSSNELSTQEGDPVILKTDGLPTYHFANVVDDHLMGVTHVLRGYEWLASTSKHLLIYRAFKWDPPKFGHLPLLLNEDGSKLSKRHGHFQVKNLREKGYFPNSVINFITCVGGGYDVKTEKSLRIYTLEQLAEKFDLSKIKLSSGKVRMDLLPSYNHAEILRQLDSVKERQDLAKKVQEIVQKHFEDSLNKNSKLLETKRIEYILDVLKHRILNLEDVVSEDFQYLWHWENKWDVTNESYNEMIKKLNVEIKEVSWTLDDLKEFLKSFCKNIKHVKYIDVMQHIRLALTGKKVGHGVAEIMVTLLKEDVLYRLSVISQNESKCDVKQN